MNIKTLRLAFCVFMTILFCSAAFAEEKRMSMGMIKENIAVEISIDRDLLSTIFPALSNLLWEDGYTAFKTRGEFVQLKNNILNNGGTYTFVLISDSPETMSLPEDHLVCLIHQWLILKEENGEVVRLGDLKNFTMDKNNPNIEKLFLAITQTE